jgi:hypothetical protein
MSTAKARARTPIPRWLTPVVGLVAGVLMLVASWAGGHPGTGVAMLGIMVVFSAAVWLASFRSETVRGVLDHGDERLAAMDLHATAFSGLVLIIAVIVGFLVSIAQGHDGSPYTWLAASAGIAYIVALVALRLLG